MNADLIIRNGKVITVDHAFSIKEAIAVRAGKIIAVGTDDEIDELKGSDTKVIDLKGKTILPGINESHMHTPFFGATRPPLALDLTAPNVLSIKDMAETLEKKVTEMKPGEWIRLRSIVQGILARHPAVESFGPPHDGGSWGATVARLRPRE